MNKKYQIFISSTYEDLKYERSAVRDQIITMGDFPVQMETFPASPKDQLDYIRPLIRESDYYILIVGGRYGTIRNQMENKSYTHLEYEYAQECEIPTLVFTHEDYNSLVGNKIEHTDEGKRKLRDFIKEVRTGRMVAEWKDANDLKAKVSSAIEEVKKHVPRKGWVRAEVSLKEQSAPRNALSAVEQSSSTASEFLIDGKKIQLGIPNFEDSYELNIFREGSESITEGLAVLKSTRLKLFPIFRQVAEIRYHDWGNEDFTWFYVDKTATNFADNILKSIFGSDYIGGFTVSKDEMNRLKDYYIEQNLIFENGGEFFTADGEKLARRLNVNKREDWFKLICEDQSIFTDRTKFSDEFDDEIPF